MKKFLANALLALFVCSAGLLACAESVDETPFVENETEVSLKDIAYDTDQTPPDTGAVIR